MSFLRKFKKFRTASKHPVLLANSTHDVTTGSTRFDADGAPDTNPEGVFRLIEFQSGQRRR
jgi:hypothetical protein